ncbi:hypothetical protein MN608_06063 [Microdochium nivale]|nr:hypothetical protein MN608_06063 [Microdochium nivale]
MTPSANQPANSSRSSVGDTPCLELKPGGGMAAPRDPPPSLPPTCWWTLGFSISGAVPAAQVSRSPNGVQTQQTSSQVGCLSGDVSCSAGSNLAADLTGRRVAKNGASRSLRRAGSAINRSCGPILVLVLAPAVVSLVTAASRNVRFHRPPSVRSTHRAESEMVMGSPWADANAEPM